MFENIIKNIPTNFRYGYVRVSSESQEKNPFLEVQKQKLIGLAIPENNIRVEVGSAADLIRDRPVFQKLIEEELQKNAFLVVTKVDRCSRNALEFLRLQDKLDKKSVGFIALDLPYSEDMAVNKLIGTHLAAMATFENERRKKRQLQGIKAARKAGTSRGRKTVITKKLINQVKDLKETNNLSITQIAKMTGRARTTVYKILKKELNYVPHNRLVKKEEQNESKYIKFC